jgi:regulator of sigma E protease
MLAWLAPLIVFGLVVFVHELGHFLAAKLTGVYAPVFSFGWGPRLWGIRRGETDYRVSWLPIGGFVAMATRDSESASTIEGNTSFDEGHNPDSGDKEGHQRGLNPVSWDPNALRPFGPNPVPSSRWIESKSLLAKIFVLSAGVLMNVVLAVVVSTTSIYTYGRPYLPAVADSVVPGLAAARGGLLAGDSIVAIDGRAVERWPEVVDIIAGAPGRALTFSVVRRTGEQASLTITPVAAADSDAVTGAPIRSGASASCVRAAWNANRSASRLRWWTDLAPRHRWRPTCSRLWVASSGQVSVKQLGGPIQIARVSFQAAKTGVETLLYLLHS